MGSPGRCVSLTVPVRHNVPKAPGGQPTASEQPPDEYGGAAPMPRTQASWHRFVREQHRVAAGDAGRGGSDLVGAGSCARGTAGRRPSGVTDPGAVTERDRRRLERWRTTHGPAADDAWFTERLADLDLDPAGLLALLAEPPADLAARTTRPAWAELTEAVIARTGTESGVPDDELTSASGFGLIVAGFVDAAIDQFVELAPGAAPVSDVDIDALRTGLGQRLTNQLVRLAARTLVLELNVLRVTGRLRGDTPQERFTSFIRRYACRAGLATLLGEYPVLARLMGQACASAVDAQLELLRRFAADRDAIVTALLGAVDPGQLVAVEHCGDLHQGGRSTALLRFAGGARAAGPRDGRSWRDAHSCLLLTGRRGIERWRRRRVGRSRRRGVEQEYGGDPLGVRQPQQPMADPGVPDQQPRRANHARRTATRVAALDLGERRRGPTGPGGGGFGVAQRRGGGEELQVAQLAVAQAVVGQRAGGERRRDGQVEVAGDRELQRAPWR